MSNTKKFLLLVFAVAMVINLQFNAPITQNTNGSFSIEQLVENIFVAEAFASQAIGCDPELNKHHCVVNGEFGYCYFDWIVTEYCKLDQ